MGENLWGTPKFLNKLVSTPVLGRFVKRNLSDRLAVGYDIARGFVVAQEEVVKLVQSLADSETPDTDDSKTVSVIQEEINKNRIRGLNFLKNVREAHPEIAAAIETRQAIRTVLNHERNTVKTLLNDGRIATRTNQVL